jgi:signal transduction histidine kinase
VDVHGKTLFNSSNEPIIINGVLREITEKKKAIDALELANKKLALLGGITRHDMTNQMAVISGNVELMKLGAGPVDQDRLDSISRAIRNMMTEIEFARTYEKIGIGAPEWQGLKGVLRNAVQGLDLGAIEVNDRLDDCSVLADKMMNRVFFNLVDNSLRHGGNVTTINVWSEAIDGHLDIYYQDDGHGLSNEYRKHLFEKGHGSNNGFGLFLCKEIIELSGMTMDEKGTNGKGVLFHISVPFDRVRTG